MWRPGRLACITIRRSTFLSRRHSGTLAKVYQRLIEWTELNGWTWKVDHSHISPILPQFWQEVKKSEIWARSLTLVAFDVLWFQNKSSTLTGSADDWVIWFSSLLLRPTQPSIPPGSVNEYALGWEGKGRHGSFRYRMYALCAGKTEIPWERVPYLSALEVWSRQLGAVQIHVYLTLPYLTLPSVRSAMKSRDYNSFSPGPAEKSCWTISTGNCAVPCAIVVKFDTLVLSGAGSGMAGMAAAIPICWNLGSWFSTRCQI